MTTIEERAWRLRTEDGQLLLYTPDGVKVPEQIDCVISQPLELAMKRPRMAKVTVSMLVIVDESVPFGESEQSQSGEDFWKTFEPVKVKPKSFIAK